MNPNRPSSNDGTPRLTPSEVEQRLRQLQPRMPDLDVDAILEVDREEASPTQFVDRALIPEQTSPARLGWYALTWASGAVAGALLTVAFMAPWNASGAAANVETANVETEQANLPVEPAPTLASADSGQARSPRRFRNEWLVSSWLVELRSPGSNQNRALMAGDYTLQSKLYSTDHVAVTVDSEDLPPNAPRSNRSIEETDLQPTLSTKADRLLEELLGEPISTRM